MSCNPAEAEVETDSTTELNATFDWNQWPCFDLNRKQLELQVDELLRESLRLYNYLVVSFSIDTLFAYQKTFVTLCQITHHKSQQPGVPIWIDQLFRLL